MTSVFTAAMNEVISRYLYIYTSTVVRCMDGGDWPQPRVTMQVFSKHKHCYLCRYGSENILQAEGSCHKCGELCVDL